MSLAAPRVSAVIPVYNHRGLITEAIRSVHQQTRKVDELIVVDDGSTDGSGDEAAALGATVLRLPENSGPAAARNAAIRAATGDVIAFLDSDDTWMPEHCALLLAVLDRNPAVALIASRSEGQLSFDSFTSGPPFQQPFDAVAFLARENIITQSAVLARRNALLECGGYDEAFRFAEDYGLWLKLALNHPFIVLPEMTVSRRLHERQSTWNNTGPIYVMSWRLRLDLWRNPILREDPKRLAQVELALQHAVAIDLRLTWNDLDSKSFGVVASAAEHVPGSSLLRSRWRMMKSLLWRPWLLLVRGRRYIKRLWARSLVRRWIGKRSRRADTRTLPDASAPRGADNC